ncbi:hypothetical protein [Yoonia sp.]|uniref:hypothetical protein n=1 Tax=Yoonia sp. TaxID=2212373 RepID=UPI0019EC0BD2|nr:hypothetical protein [Yoonia sp.]MBE0414010.1 hypothetical protein [Yoonia sp.]
MLDLSCFKNEILEPAIQAFSDHPNRLFNAYAAVWAVDSYASHFAWSKVDSPTLSQKHRSVVELNFKNDLCKSPDAWQFKVVRALSNATKHAVRSKGSELATDSGKTRVENVDGWLWYFTGAKVRGPQVVVDLNLTWDEEEKVWREAGDDKEVFRGPLFSMVNVLDLMEPSVQAIESFTPPTSARATPPTTLPLSR